MHNGRKGIYLARGSIVREVDGPVHASAKERWDRNAFRYRSKGRALKRLLKSVDGDWSRLEVAD